MPRVAPLSRHSLAAQPRSPRIAQTRACDGVWSRGSVPSTSKGSGEAGGGAGKNFRPNTRPPPERYKRPCRRPESASQTAQRGRGSRLAQRPKRPGNIWAGCCVRAAKGRRRPFARAGTSKWGWVCIRRLASAAHRPGTCNDGAVAASARGRFGTRVDRGRGRHAPIPRAALRRRGRMVGLGQVFCSSSGRLPAPRGQASAPLADRPTQVAVVADSRLSVGGRRRRLSSEYRNRY